MTISDQKQAARKAAFAARKTAHDMGLDAVANTHLLEHLRGFPKGSIIAGYMPIRTELSPLSTMAELSKDGFTIAVPVVLDNAQPLEFHAWTPEAEMVDGAFGAAIPKDKRVVVPDVVVTPLVAFDAEGYRLGYGGGFYDRSFEQIARAKPVTAIGFAYSAQALPAVPREPTDHRLNAMITEEGVLSFG